MPASARRTTAPKERAAARRTPKASPGAHKDARTFTITELAQEFDITPRAIRFYEDVGLLARAATGSTRTATARA
jgi:hypothetical protein